MEKVGRNDPCPCGSGKKYKACCLSKKGGSGIKRKIEAKWLNPKQQAQPQGEPEELNLMDRAYGHATQSSQGAFQSIIPTHAPEGDSEKKEEEKQKDE